MHKGSKLFLYILWTLNGFRSFYNMLWVTQAARDWAGIHLQCCHPLVLHSAAHTYRGSAAAMCTGDTSMVHFPAPTSNHTKHPVASLGTDKLTHDMETTAPPCAFPNTVSGKTNPGSLLAMWSTLQSRPWACHLTWLTILLSTMLPAESFMSSIVRLLSQPQIRLPAPNIHPAVLEILSGPNRGEGQIRMYSKRDVIPKPVFVPWHHVFSS